MPAAPSDPAEPFHELARLPTGRPHALLHSGVQGRVWLCDEPAAALTVPPEEVAGAFDRLQAFLGEHRDGRCVGYLGYDLRDDVEALPRTIPDDLPVPVLHVAAYRRVRELPCAVAPPPPPLPAATPLRAHFTRRGYREAVARVVEHIRAGDIFQANLTQPFTGRFEGDPRRLFWSLCHHSPAPFAAYLGTGEGTAVLCSSPEEFLCREGGVVRSRPIKGTRPRGTDPVQDRGLLAELLASEKDQAELAMIVDLMRNDLGKVAAVGSVEVGAFPEHDSFAQVHHLFATVTARLREGVTTAELLRATFPPGSITGAPKLRCMEILEALEVVRRGVYTGAVGWFGPGERMHLNVAIRTMLWRDGVVRCNAGGGVTADSDPAAELEETLHKAAGMVRALGSEVVFP